MDTNISIQMDGSEVDDAEDMNLEDFMEVVTSYKCKFCDFTCSQPQGMAIHVKSAHIRPPVEALTTAEGVVDITTTSSNVDAGTMTGQPVLMVQGDSGDSVQDDGNSTEIPEGEIIPDAVPDQSNQSPTADSSNQLSLTTKELFLCGQCSLGFTTIDECKAHMVKDHNINLLGGYTTSVDAAVGYADKVSVGTQMNKKKPGRKRKVPQGVSESMVKRTEEIKVEEEERRREEEEERLRKEQEEETGELGKRRSRLPYTLRNDYVVQKHAKVEVMTREEKRELSSGYVLRCGQCQAKFKTEKAREIHESSHYGEIDEQDPESVRRWNFKCPEQKCGNMFYMWKGMRKHLWAVHNIDTDLYKCDHEGCDYRTESITTLGVHKQIHSTGRPYICDVCGKGFKQDRQMQNHRTTHYKHSVQRDDRFKPVCEQCGRTFVNEKCLKNHMETVHSGLKPYVCQFCGKTASRKAMMQLHIRTHTGEKPFKCDLCPYVTGDHNSLRRHKMRHTGEKPYKCTLCPYSCIQAISLKMHMKNKHPGRDGCVYNCDQCTYRTVNKKSYEHHLADHQNGRIDVDARFEKEGYTEKDEQGKAAEPVQIVEEITAADLEKLSQNYEGLGSGDVTAAQLIYSALSAISQNTQQNTQDNTVIQNISSRLAESGETHTITFQLQGTGNQPGSSIPVYIDTGNSNSTSQANSKE